MVPFSPSIRVVKREWCWEVHCPKLSVFRSKMSLESWKFRFHLSGVAKVRVMRGMKLIIKRMAKVLRKCVRVMVIGLTSILRGACEIVMEGD